MKKALVLITLFFFVVVYPCSADLIGELGWQHKAIISEIQKVAEKVDQLASQVEKLSQAQLPAEKTTTETQVQKSDNHKNQFVEFVDDHSQRTVLNTQIITYFEVSRCGFSEFKIYINIQSRSFSVPGVYPDLKSAEEGMSKLAKELGLLK